MTVSVAQPVVTQLRLVKTPAVLTKVGPEDTASTIRATHPVVSGAGGAQTLD